MKFIIAFLFVLQLIIGGMIGVTSLRVTSINQLLFANTIDVEIIFDENLEAYETFLSILEREHLTVSRVIFRSFEHVHIYTTDPTFDGLVTLSFGQWPDEQTQGFISNVRHDDPYQLGLITNSVPNFEVMIHYLSADPTIHVDGVYRINTVDNRLIFAIRDELLASYELLFRYMGTSYAPSGLIQGLMIGIFSAESVMETALLILIPLITFFCLVMSLIQYGLSRLKTSFVTRVHGFSTSKIIGYAVVDLMKPLLTSGLLAYLCLTVYTFVLGYHFFLPAMSLIFVVTSSILISIYILTAVVTLFAALMSCKTHDAIKGYKPDFMIQVLNHGFKVVFTSCLLIGSYFLLVHLQDLSARRTNLSHWGLAEDVYHLPTSHFWPIEHELTMSERMVSFYETLFASHHAFLMDARNIYFYEVTRLALPFDLPYILMEIEELNLPFAINPTGNRIDIDLNYLQLNPIRTMSGAPIETYIIHDDFTSNILVPIQFAPYEAEIKAAYLQDFYEQGLSVNRRFNDFFELSDLTLMIDDLRVNVIYVEEEQYYFSFNPHVRVETGNRIRDPIAVIQTGNMAPSNKVALMSSSLFFVSHATYPFAAIFPLIESYELTYQFRFVSSVFNEHASVIATLRRDILRNTVMLVALIVTSVTVSYHLISNYFLRNKHLLFTKGLFGYSFVKRHDGFITVFLTYTLGISMVVTMLFGFSILLIFSLYLVGDVLLMVEFERRLMKKSFAEIMKGER